jgi:hypothetical protein
MSLEKQQLNNVIEKLQSFEPITLAEMDGVSLMNRTDTKFVFQIKLLPEILSAVQPFYKSLEIKGNRFANYKTDYFDTQDFFMFTAHQNGKQNRYKVRYREYVGADLSFLEVKFKNNKGKTSKSRIKSWINYENFDNKDSNFLNASTPFATDNLKHVLTNDFSRITLVSKTDKERLTIDFSLSFSKDSKLKNLDELVIAEVKQEKVNRNSKVMQVLKENGIRKASFSKYASGATLLNQQLKYNQFKSNMLYLNKIHKDYGVIWNR